MDASKTYQAGRIHLQAVRQNNKLIHKEWCEDGAGQVAVQTQTEMTFAIGSGSQSRSYLHLRDGYLFESPITWYSRKSAWALSPGYEKKYLHFDRPVEHGCLYCHSQESLPIEGSINQYERPVFRQLAIGCERCHGPGALHVVSRKQGAAPADVDYTIVNPRHLSPPLRDAICEQCHLQGEAIISRRGRRQADYRPGLPLHEFVSVFVRRPQFEDERLIVGHVEQMRQSACFNRSKGRFGCTSCHDPHGMPPADQMNNYYNQRCRDCHTSPLNRLKREFGDLAPDCSLPQEQRNAKGVHDNCLKCHMPRSSSSNAVHFAVTDHRIPRRLQPVAKANPRQEPVEFPIEHFHRHLAAARDEDFPRDLALAVIPYVKTAMANGADQISRQLGLKILPLLNNAVARDSDDVAAQEGRGHALFASGQLDDALTALEDVLRKSPDRETTLIIASEVAYSMNRLDLAQEYCQRLLKKNPHVPGYHERLALIQKARGAASEAIAAAEAALKINPLRAETRELLIRLHLAVGHLDRAQSELSLLGHISPERQNALRSIMTASPMNGAKEK